MPLIFLSLGGYLPNVHKKSHLGWRALTRWNIVVPLFLTMGRKVYSQRQLYKNAMCADIQKKTSATEPQVNGFSCLFSICS